jgi:hypothetical protein
MLSLLTGLKTAKIAAEFRAFEKVPRETGS